MRAAPGTTEALGARCLAHVEALCAPALAGRLAGSDGERLAVAYLRDRLCQLPGLHLDVEPLSCPVPSLDAAPSLRIDGRALTWLEDFGVAVQGAAGAGRGTARALWLAHADPDDAWPEVRGRAVVCWSTPPTPLAPGLAFERYLQTVRRARDRGALALLRVVDEPLRCKVMLHRREEPGLPVLEITPAIAHAIFAPFPPAPGAPGGQIELDVPLRVVVTPLAGNLVARLGAGPPRLVLCAHHDGVGRLADGRSCPGAQDNASGVAALLELLDALAAGLDVGGSLIAVFTAAEEIGMFGARALLAAHPTWREAAPIFVVVDELAGVPGEPLHLLASPALRQALSSVAPALPGLLRRGPLPSLAFADHLPALEAGLAAVGIVTAPDRRGDRVHRPEDMPAHLSPARLGELTAALTALARILWQLSPRG